jgi:hypothetical protein
MQSSRFDGSVLLAGLAVLVLLACAATAGAEERMAVNTPPVAVCDGLSAPPTSGLCLTVDIMDVGYGCYDPDGAGDIADVCIVGYDGSPVACTHSISVCGAGHHTLTVRITDMAGEFDECTAHVYVLNEPPVAECVPAYPPPDGTCCAWVSVDMINYGSFDPDPWDDIAEIDIIALDDVDVGREYDVYVCGLGTHSIKMRVADYTGTADTCETFVEIDNIPPVAECEPITWPVDPTCCVTVYVDDIDDGSYDPDGNLIGRCIVAVDGVDVGCQPFVDVCGVGHHTLTMRVEDNCGIYDYCDADVYLYGDYPEAWCQPYEEHGDENCCINVSVYDIDNGSFDPDGGIADMCIVEVDGIDVGCQTNVEVCGRGMHTLRMRVEDNCGQFDYCEAEVEVTNYAPVAQCQQHVSGYPDYECCMYVGVGDLDDGSYDPDGEDDIAKMGIINVDGTPIDTLGYVYVCGAGDHGVTLLIRDHCGEYDICSSQVTIFNDPPTAICQPYMGYADENCCITVTPADIDGGSYDPNGAENIESLCIVSIDGVPVGCQEEVEVCGVGIHPVVLRITDWCGETDECTADVEVVDVTPPEIEVTLNRYELWPPNHKMVDIVATLLVEDNCDPDPEIVLVSITSNEPDDNGGDGETDDDIQGADFGTEDYEFELRSERSGKRTGRVYTITYMATDFSGNSAQDVAYVRVPHDHTGLMFTATGFTADGTGFADNVNEFAVVIPSRKDVYDVKHNGKPELVEAMFDATQLDPAKTLVGNTMGVLTPERAALLDQNGDGMMDLALWYRVAGVTPFVEHVYQGQMGEVWITDPIDPVGIHYRSSNGVDYLVPDIFGLGAPETLGGSGSAGVEDIRPTAELTRLFPVQPNPFSAATTIRFSLAGEEHVTLRIYDAMGLLVKTLEDRVMASGMHHAVWDGKDDLGRPVAAGVYFTRITAGAYRATEKTMYLH